VAATQAVVAAGISKTAFRRRGLAYDGPVVALWGDRDRLVPASHAAGVAAALPQARIEIWPGMGHHPQHERPDELVELMAGAAPSPAVNAPRGERRRRAA
jgi:pimeloyl-ACP methyl ester carboxylesterase